MITAETTFPGCPESAAAARAWVAGLLPGCCPALDDVLLCTSELVTNSIRYSRSHLPGGEMTVRAEITAGAALVEVVDQGPDMPGAVSAHGLGAGWQIIRELAGHCGRDGNRAWLVVTWQPGLAEAETATDAVLADPDTPAEAIAAAFAAEAAALARCGETGS